MLEFFDDFKQSVAIYNRVSTINQTTGQSTTADSLVGTYDVILYKLSIAQRYFYDRLDSDITAKLIIDPDIAPTLTDTMYALIDDVKWFFVSPDDIMDLGEVIEIGCAKEVSP